MSTKDLKSMSPREVLEAHAAGRLALEDAEKALRAGWMEDVGSQARPRLPQQGGESLIPS